mgnify:CR=1 FL=1
MFAYCDNIKFSINYLPNAKAKKKVNPKEIKIEGDSIDIEIRIYEGKQARINRVTLIGNTKTSDYVVMREIRTKPGDLFRRSDIIRSQRELAQLKYFNPEKMSVNPKPNAADGTVDIEYIVEEQPSDQVELSAGYGGRRLVGTLGLSFNNFSTKRMLDRKSWTPLPSGDGQTFSIRAQSTGLQYQSYNASFIEPWLGGKKPNSLSFWLNHTALSANGKLKSEDGYAGLSISGIGVGLGKRNKWPDDYFSTYYELGYKYYDVVNDTRFPIFSKGFANDISLQQTIQRTSVSAPTYPQGGSNFVFLAL